MPYSLANKIEQLRSFARELPAGALHDPAQVREDMYAVPGFLWSKVAMPSGKIVSSEGGALREMGLMPGEMNGSSIYDWPHGAIIDAIEDCYREQRAITRIVSSSTFSGLFLGTWVPVNSMEGTFVQAHVIELTNTLRRVLPDASELAEEHKAVLLDVIEQVGVLLGVELPCVSFVKCPLAVPREG